MSITFDLSHFLLYYMRFGKQRACYLDRLPNDILVDQIFSYLGVKEILRMRRVSKLHYHLSQNAALWKRLLKRIDYPLPPVPPTSRHSLARLSGFEVERLITRPLSLDLAWHSLLPDSYDDWHFDAQYHVKSMVFLPGGQYLVASVSDLSDRDHSVVLWMLDHAGAPVIPLAKTSVSTRAHRLQARYMTVGGRNGITISFVCRNFKYTTTAAAQYVISQYSGLLNINDRICSIDLSKFRDDQDVNPRYPIVYDCTVLHAPLDLLESIIADPRFIPGSLAFLHHARTQPSPFRRITVFRSDSRLGPATMDEIGGSPYIAIIRHPNTIIFKNLDGGAISRLTPSPADPGFTQPPHEIMAMRMLPNQNQILTVRRVARRSLVPNEHDIFPLEIFDIPVNLSDVPLDVTSDPVERVFLVEDTLREVDITDHYILARNDESLNKHVFGTDTKPPRPISIIARCISHQAEHGLVRFTIYPEKVHYDPTTPPPPADVGSRPPSPVNSTQGAWYKYRLQTCSPVRFVKAPCDLAYRALPGSYRSIVYTIPINACDLTDTPPVVSIKRYWDDECLERPSPEQLSDELYYSTPRRPLRKIGYDWEVTENLSASAWDETIGRLCMVAEKSSNVLVLDFAKAPREDPFGRRLPLCLPLEGGSRNVEQVDNGVHVPINYWQGMEDVQGRILVDED